MQDEIFAECVEPLLDSCFDGYNVSVLAYGQTGAGKTFTMGTTVNNTGSSRGIIPRALSHIFDRIEKDTENHYVVHASFLEIYLEDVIDLLSTVKSSGVQV